MVPGPKGLFKRDEGRKKRSSSGLLQHTDQDRLCVEMSFGVKKVCAFLKADQLKHLTTRCLNSKVPQQPVDSSIDGSRRPQPTKIDQRTIELLERLSLVDFGNKAGIERLESAIKFADEIRAIDTTDIEPMVTPLEDNILYLRKDEVTDGNCRHDVMANASVTEEEYFVAPQGNIPLTPRPNLLDGNKQ